MTTHEENVSRYNGAVERMNEAVERVKAAKGKSQVDAAETDFRNCLADVEAAKAVLEREEEINSATERFHPTPIDGSGYSRGSGGSGTLMRNVVTGETFRAFRHGESMAGVDSRDVNGVAPRDLDLGRALRGIVMGDWRGSDAELRALSGGASTGGLTLLPDVLGSKLIDYARAESVCSQAGMQTVDFDQLGAGPTYRLAKVTADPTVSWVAEAGTITPADPAFGQVLFTSHKGVVITKISRELLNDAANAEVMLRNVLSSAVAAAIDKAALEGNASNGPSGLSEYSASNGIAVQSMGTNGAIPTASNGPSLLVALMTSVMQGNARPNAIISSPRTFGHFQSLVDSTYQPLRLAPEIEKLPWFVTSQISDVRAQGTASNSCSNLYMGDFTQLMLGVRQGLEIYVTRDAALLTDEIYVFVNTRVDVQPMRLASFGKLVGIKD